MQPGTIAKLALKATDFPNGEPSLPFMGAFVQLFPGAKLPAEAAVSAYQPTYDASIAAQQAAAQAKAAIPDLATQLAAALVAKGTINKTDIDPGTLTAINAKLQAGGKAIIK